MQLSDAEWKVMHALWARHPATARELLEALDRDTEWAYSTVKTLLARLVEKGAIGERKRANTSVYRPLVTRAAARRSAVRGLLEKAFDGAFGPLLHHLVDEETLSDAEREQLRAMLAEEDEDGAARGAGDDADVER